MKSPTRMLLIGALCSTISLTLLSGCYQKNDAISTAEQADLERLA
jgi:hypothetical protein